MLDFLVLVIILFILVGYLIYGLLKLDNITSGDSDKKYTKELIETIINSEDDELKENLKLLLDKLNKGE